MTYDACARRKNKNEKHVVTIVPWSRVRQPHLPRAQRTAFKVAFRRDHAIFSYQALAPGTDRSRQNTKHALPPFNTAKHTTNEGSAARGTHANIMHATPESRRGKCEPWFGDKHVSAAQEYEQALVAVVAGKQNPHN